MEDTNTMYKYRKLQFDQDYPVLAEIFVNDYGWPNPPQPHDLAYDSFVVEDDKGVMGALFLYTVSNSGACLILFPILSKRCKQGRDEVVEKLWLRCEILAEYLGYSRAIVFASAEHIKNRLVKRDYIIGDRNMDQMVKVLR